MAASPPPYQPPLTPDEQRRQQKAYWQAQKAAMRSQRDAWKSQRRDQRYYWQSMHRPSIVGPIVLLAFGVVALLINLGKLSGPLFWDWLISWWPLLLVGIGIVSLLEWFLDRDQPYKRKTNAFGIILLISILVGIAYSRGHLNRWSNEMGAGNPRDWPSMMGEEHERDSDSSISIPANAAVQIQNPRGDVTITGSSDGELKIHAHQVVNTNSDSEADRAFTALAPKVTVNGSSVLVRVESRNNGRADLTIEVPVGASTDVTAGRGDVSVEGIKGATNITAGRGDVKLSEIGGSAHAHMSKGDFSAHQLAGSVSIDGHLEDVTISDVTGSVSLDGDFFGDTHLEQIGSTVHFHSSRTDLDLGRLGGDLTMDSDDLHVGQAVGPLRIVTRSKNIECTQISGDVHIENSNGDVAVTAVEPLGNIQINNASDPVTLTLPPNAGFQINATTNGGDLNTDFGLNLTGGDEHRNGSGTVGKGGPKIEINTRHGDISIKKGDLVAPPMPPMPPMPSVTAPKIAPVPRGPEKHLHAPQGVDSAPKVL